MTAARKTRPAPARELFAVPDPVPTPPAWAVEAAEPTQPEPTRDFSAQVERVRSDDGRMVVRTRDAGGHIYRAWERADTLFYGETLDELTWGRVDSRRPAQPSDDPRAAIEHQLACEAEARDLIHELCPETVRRGGETVVGSGVYEGPGYVLVTSNPEARYQAALAARRPA